MTLLKRNNGGLVPFRSYLSNFFEPDDLVFDRLWSKDWVPAVNVSENDKTWEIEVAAPGMRKEDFKVKVEKGVLTISSERKEEREEKKRNYTFQEYNFNSFTR